MRRRYVFMPCVAVHMLVARDVARRWRRHPDDAPVDVRSPGVLRAFYHGALAPDMGFAPGADRFVSDLTHHLATGDLARSLLDHSRDEVEKAFAWGWITHVLADSQLHPLVGRAMGQRLLGDRHLRMNTHEDLEAHVSIEVGLDALVLARSPGVPSPPFRVLDGPERLQPLAEALEQTFGIPWRAGDLYESHRRTARLFALWPLGLRLLLRGAPALSTGGGAAGRRLVRRVLAFLSARARGGTAVSGYLRPSRPPKWLLGTVMDRARTFPARFQALVRGGLSDMGNPSLETGGPAGPGQGHPVADGIAAELSRRRIAAGHASPALPAGEAGIA